MEGKGLATRPVAPLPACVHTSLEVSREVEADRSSGEGDSSEISDMRESEEEG